MRVAEYYERPVTSPRFGNDAPEHGAASDERIRSCRRRRGPVDMRNVLVSRVTVLESRSGSGAINPVDDDSGIGMWVLPQHHSTGGVAAVDDQIDTRVACRVVHVYDVE